MASNMINIVQGTTPTLTFTISGYDLTDKTVEIYIMSRAGLKVLTDDRLSIAYSEGTSIIVLQLTQAETLKMPVGMAKVQIRFINSSGQTDATVDDAAQLNVLAISDHKEIVYRG